MSVWSSLLIGLPRSTNYACRPLQPVNGIWWMCEMWMVRVIVSNVCVCVCIHELSFFLSSVRQSVRLPPSLPTVPIWLSVVITLVCYLRNVDSYSRCLGIYYLCSSSSSSWLVWFNRKNPIKHPKQQTESIFVFKYFDDFFYIFLCCLITDNTYYLPDSF